jgi:hypothetical protein
MSIGIGIFLGALSIAVVLLYAATKDRWRWRKIVRRFGFSFIALVVLFLFASISTYIWYKLPLPRQTQYAGLALGISPDEVVYRKGPPDQVLEEPETTKQGWTSRAVTSTQEIKDGKSFRDYGAWSYETNTSHIDIQFNPAKTAVVEITCYSKNKAGSCPPIAEIKDGDTEDVVLSVLRQPDISRLDGPSTTKNLIYKSIGVSLWLERQQVYMIGIGDAGWRSK